MKKTSAERYENLAHVCYERAMDESVPMPLRQYYAKLALWADKQASHDR